jgi:xanthine dehydrogenase accessory factor
MSPWQTVMSVIDRHGLCALATVIDTKGSTPRETDAWMIVTEAGFHGSIGGGTVEWRVMAEAQAMLGSVKGKRRLDYVLGPDLGQCCGGRMVIEIEIFTRADQERVAQWANEKTNTINVFVFGAGHVGRALVMALAPLPYNVTWIDPRPEAFPSVVPTNVTLRNVEYPVSILSNVPDQSFVYVLTHSHALDFEIVDAALRNPSLHVGVIGSSTKRARFEKRLLEAAIHKDRVSQLMCPIGIGGIQSKLPAAIAASVVAQVLQLETASRVSGQTLQQETA